MVATGLDVTAVEVDENFCHLVAERGHGPGRLDVEQADMLTFFAGERYDAAVFYESFHHCADHLTMLRHLHGIVRPEGAVFFAAEPVQRLEYPWGPRLDGLSVWSSRTHGWLELGFDERYFFAALTRTGWHGQRLQAGPRPGETDVIVARSAFGGRARRRGHGAPVEKGGRRGSGGRPALTSRPDRSGVPLGAGPAASVGGATACPC